jgi:hypothetical protein
VNSSTSLTVNVVLPDFFQPATPTIGTRPVAGEECEVLERVTRGPHQSGHGTNLVCNRRSASRGQHAPHLGQFLRRIGIKKRINGLAANLQGRKVDAHSTMPVGPCQNLPHTVLKRGFQVVRK